MIDYRSEITRSDVHPDTAAFFKDRTVLVHGGSGFIGSHVVEGLLQLGAKPIITTRRADPPFVRHLRSTLQLRQVDLLDRDATLAATRGCSVVLNLAASVAGLEYNSKHPVTIFDANIRTFLNVLQAAKECEVERFLVTSSACVYQRHCSIPTPEEEGFLGVPEPTNSGYGWAKRMEEFLGHAAAAEFGMSVAIARPYNAYGPRDNFSLEMSHVLPALIRRAYEARDGRFTVWGDGSHSRSFLYVDDFARGLLEVAARYPKADAINLGADEEITIREAALLIAKSVSSITGKSLEPIFQPAGLTGQPRRRCSIEKAQRILGFKAKTTFEQGLQRTIEWYATHADSAVHSHA